MNVDPEIYIGRGYQRLNNGAVAAAAEDLSTAIDLVPEHGIALGLSAIAAMRADDQTLQRKIIDRYRCASKKLLSDLGEVGKWYSRPLEPGADAMPERKTNRDAFRDFVRMLASALENDRERLFWLAEGLHAAQLATVASDVLTRYCQKFPGHQDAEAMLINSVILACDFADSERFLHEQCVRAERQLSAVEPISIDPYNMCMAGADIGFISRVCRRRSLDFQATDAPIAGRRGRISPGDRPIRVAFVLPYSWFASVSVTMAAILSEFDRRIFEIYGYALNTDPNPNEFEIRYRECFDRFVALDGLTPKAAAARIETDDIDIAFDISGHNRTTCLPILAYRPAPLQAHFFGWGTVIEAPYIDYLVADPHFHPKHLRDLTTETYALMPHGSWVYPVVELPAAEPGSAFSDGLFRFCSFNHLGKLDSETFAAWLEILRRTEKSIMVLCHWNLADAVRNIQSAAERADIASGRFVFVPVINHVDHLQRLRTMDLALDTIRHGGGVTTMDAFRVGLPVVAACPHENCLYPCRGPFGSLSMTEEIVTDHASYVRRAIELRNDQRSLAALREKVAARRDAALMFDPPRFTREFERLILEMWARHLRGDEPTTFMLS
jgi:hypothetical protein